MDDLKFYRYTTATLCVLLGITTIYLVLTARV